MSLPWMHGTVYQYVEETVKKLHAATPSLTHLKLGNFFVLQQATVQLTATQLSSMLQLVPFNPQLEELTMSGIHINSILDNSNRNRNRNIQSPVWKDLRQALLRATTTSPSTTTTTPRGGWKKISYLSCQGQGIQALSLPSAMDDNDDYDDDDDDNVDDDDDEDHENTNSTTAIITGVVNVKHLHIAKCQLNHRDYDALGKFLQYSTTVIRLTVVEENLAQAATTALRPNTTQQRRSATKTTPPPTPWSQSLATPTCSLEILELLECQLQSSSSSSSSSSNDNRDMEHVSEDTTVTDENQSYSYSVFLEDLAHGLTQNASLTTLNFHGCLLEDESLAKFIRDGRLQDHPKLQRILLLRNHCGDQGLTQLAALVARSTNFAAITTSMTTTVIPDLTNIDRVENFPDMISSAVATTAMVPPSRLQLQQLDLSNQHCEQAEETKLTISHTFALALASPYCSLKSLLLKFNKLVDEDAILLAFGLRYNNGTLKELDLRSNRIGDSGVIAIASTLHNSNNNNNNNNNNDNNTLNGNWKSSNSDIDRHDIFVQGLSCLSKSPPLSSSGLLQLHLFGNTFGDEGATALRNAIQENYNMTTLNLPYSSCWYREIHYYTCLNIVGRKLLQAQYNNNSNNDRDTSSFFVPGLYPLVLARADRISSRISRGICTGPDSLFYFLVRGGPVVLGERQTMQGESIWSK
jgi:hypothetical protein